MTKQDISKQQAAVTANDGAAPSPALGPAQPSGPANTAVEQPEQSLEPRSRDGLVVSSIAIVALAVAVMCYAQFGLALSVSAAAGVVTLALLMLIHKQLQKSAQINQLKAELAHSRQVPRQKGARRGVPVPAAAAVPAPALAPTTAEARIRELSRDIGNLVPRPDTAAADPAQSATAPIANELAADRVKRRLTRAVAPPRGDVPARPAAENNTGAPAPVVQVPDAEATPAAQAPSAEPVREQWAFRPRSEAQASVQDVSAATSVAGFGAPGPRGGVAATVEGDLELVQRKIKELADEVNATEALRPRPQRGNTLAKGPSGPLEESIGALKAAAKSMRERPSLGDFVPRFEAPAFSPQPTPAAEPSNEPLGELIIPATAERIASSDAVAPLPPMPSLPMTSERDVTLPNPELPLPPFVPAPAPTLPPRMAEIARAVEHDTMDILLGPIVTLAQHAVTHYEMSAKLRTTTGEPLDFEEEDFAVIGGELDAQFDIARFNRAAALAARMDARDREGSLLADFFGSSMTSRAFLETFANAYETRKRIAEQLVLTFTQRAVDEFSPSAWQAIRDMHAFGFRMALDKVRHVGTDFAALQRSGFRFVRLDAQAILEGITTAERFVPPDEILQRATLAGLSIIADGIMDVGTQKRLLESGIALGQGPLFGVARQVNVATSGPADQSAAA